MSNMMPKLLNGEGQGGGWQNGGSMMISQSQAHEYLKTMGVPNGAHTFMMKAGHSGMDGSSDYGQGVSFTITSSGFESVTYEGSYYASYDLPFCACEMSVDCPSFFT